MNFTSEKRPFYLIAHACNSRKMVRKAFEQKVNAIECDVYFDKKWFVSHDGLVKLDLVEWLQFLASLLEKYLCTVVIFDIKNEGDFNFLRQTVEEHLPESLSRIYSVAKVEDAAIFKKAAYELKCYEGLSIDEEDNPEKVENYFSSINVKQCWYGNGMTLIPVNDTYHKSMKMASEIRDRGTSFSKIYTWTVNRKSSMRKYIIEDGIDGLMVDLDGILFKPVSKAKKLIRKIHWLRMAEKSDKLFR
jgi:glycerophosphoryl diester phosphodiesterase